MRDRAPLRQRAAASRGPLTAPEPRPPCRAKPVVHLAGGAVSPSPRKACSSSDPADGQDVHRCSWGRPSGGRSTASQICHRTSPRGARARRRRDREFRFNRWRLPGGLDVSCSQRKRGKVLQGDGRPSLTSVDVRRLHGRSCALQRSAVCMAMGAPGGVAALSCGASQHTATPHPGSLCSLSRVVVRCWSQSRTQCRASQSARPNTLSLVCQNA